MPVKAGPTLASQTSRALLHTDEVVHGVVPGPLHAATAVLLFVVLMMALAGVGWPALGQRARQVLAAA